MNASDFHREKYSTARHSLNLYHCVSITGRYAVPPGTGDEEHLRAALQRAVAQVVSEQPLMRVGIIDEDKQNTSYVHVPRIDLLEQTQLFGPSQPDEVDATLGRHLSYQHSQLWPDIEQRPPWKIAVIPIASGKDAPAEIEVVYSFHHAVSDGTSGSIFHTRLLEALRNPVKDIQGFNGKLLELPNPPILPPPQNELINTRISWSFFLATLWDAFGPSWLKSKPAVVPWTSRQIDLSLSSHTSVRILRISSLIAAKLLTAARGHSLTLTSLLHALITASVSRRLPATEASAFKPCSPVSLRRYLPAGAELHAKKDMLVLVTSADHSIPSSLVTKLRDSSGPDYESAIWEVAACVKTSLEEKLATLPHDDAGAMLKYVGDYHEYFREKNGGERGNSWELSNLGAIRGGEDDGNWKLVRAVFSQSASLLGPAFSANVAGVAGGEVTITLCWNTSVVDGSLFDGLAADLGAWVSEIANGVPLTT
ncbi:hypothetical protein CkaCkLH20_11040 [Colletotrichum karsti]|uniref:Alcohol acetyltransferase FCK4 n=1 Tax=Colletotrichum karsti TaxID=1095194 RepID=A0A9P6LFE2_9PEZI|nr:uncharacterized protein CkaCkLH20_11040 [Colletotrichum karsti]KAF9871393.1 hypothetical protein CkaCkLH20_11040 [Colletotrichum karsti]